MADPIGAIGNYWATPHQAGETELRLLQALADSTSVALENVRLYEEQERRVRQREEFIAVAAHELRTPLAALQLNLQMLQREAHGEVHDRNVTLASAATRRMTSLVESLLDASVVNGEQVRLDRRKLDLAELVREEASQHAMLAKQARCALVVRADRPVEGSWDPRRLRQALANLLSNAFKYGAANPVELAVEQVDGVARLTVHDHGPGVPASEAEHIFDAFQRAAPLRHYGGFGVGLYLTRRIVEAHGGTIQVRSVPGAGTTFQVELPRH